MNRRACLAVAMALLLGGCSGVSFIDNVTIVNETEYPANDEVTNENRDGWLALTVVVPQSTRTVEAVIDQGEVWIFRFD